MHHGPPASRQARDTWCSVLGGGVRRVPRDPAIEAEGGGAGEGGGTLSLPRGQGEGGGTRDPRMKGQGRGICDPRKEDEGKRNHVTSRRRVRGGGTS